MGGTQENIGDDLELTLVKDVLGKLPALRELHIRIEDTVGWKTSQALGSLLSESLTVLHCSLDFNAPFVAFLRRQTQLRELHCECAFPEGIIPSSKWEKILVSTDDNMLPKSPQAVPTTRCRFLPNLRALRTNSHTLALGLISGRPMSHVWITESNAFISAPPKSPTYSSTTRRMTAGAPEPQPQFFSHESDTTLRETFWSDLFYKFAIVLASQTTCEAGTRSVRLDFEDVPQGVVADGLKNFAKWLGPTVRTLGFLNNAAVDEVTIGIIWFRKLLDAHLLLVIIIHSCPLGRANTMSRCSLTCTRLCSHTRLLSLWLRTWRNRQLFLRLEPSHATASREGLNICASQ